GDPWAREHELTLALHDALIEAAFIAGDHEAVALRAQAVIQACAEPLEQVEARVALIQSLSARLCMTEAVAESRRALDSLGVAVPSPLRMPRAMLELLAVWGKLERGGLARLTELPEAEDPLHIARCRVMSAAMLGAVSCEPPLLLLLNARTVRMALTHGMHPEVSFALAGISFILAGPMGQHRAGLKVVETAQRMVDRPGYEAVYTRVNYMARSYIAPLFDPVSKSIAALRGLVLRGRELGDIEFASLSAGVLMMQAMFVAGDLEGLLAEAMGYRRVVHKLGREMAIYVVDVYTQLIANLAGHGDETVTLTGEYWLEQEHEALARFVADNDLVALMLYYMAKTFAAAFHGDFATAARAHRESGPYRLAQSGQAPVFPWFRVVGIVSTLALETQPGSAGARSAVRALRSELGYLRKIAGLSSENYGFGLELALGEQARLRGRKEEARDHYRRAVDLSQGAGLIGFEAFCRERQARFLLSIGETEAGAAA
ncbi:MAG: hypothetical protein KC431_28380, partial [Myxococcales bacterium]|nr:hypothetical protein [Myxococcales bacterium]